MHIVLYINVVSKKCIKSINLLYVFIKYKTHESTRIQFYGLVYVSSADQSTHCPLV